MWAEWSWNPGLLTPRPGSSHLGPGVLSKQRSESWVSPWFGEGPASPASRVPSQLCWPGEGIPLLGPRPARVYISTHGDNTGHRGRCRVGSAVRSSPVPVWGSVQRATGRQFPRETSPWLAFPVSPAALRGEGPSEEGLEEGRKEEAGERDAERGAAGVGGQLGSPR